MAKPTTQTPSAAGGLSPGRMGPAQKLSIAAMVIGLFNKAGLNSVLASAAVAIAAPAAATAFVYEVSALRSAQLEHEAKDRSSDVFRVATQTAPTSAEGDKGRPATPPPLDMGGKLDGMIASRSKMLDLFGDDPSTVPPVYARIIRQMLSDDDATLASLRAHDDDGDAEALAAKGAMLRVVHARLGHLVGA